MAVIVNGDGILTGISNLATDLTDITSGRGTITGVTTVGTLQLGAGVSISSPRSQQAAIFTNNTEFLTVDDAGRVGVGTITPNSDAHPENEKKINVGFITAKSVAGDIDARNVVVAGISTFTGAIDANSTSNFGDDVVFAGAAANITFDKSDNALEFADDAKATFGTGADCTLTHSGSDFAITEATGNINLLCNSSGNIHLRHNAESMLRAITNDTVEIYYNNSKRLHTTPSGVDVTGTINVTGVSTVTALTATTSLTVDTSGSGLPALFLTHSNSGADDWKVMAGITGVSNSGFSIYDVDSTTSRFIIDTNGNIGINNTAPVEKLGIDGNIRFINANGDTSRITALPSGSYNVGSSGGSAVCFQRTADGGGGSDEIFFETHWQGNFHGERLRIEKNGDIKVNGGDLYFATAGRGVVLGATSNTDANTLDDYEEGNYTVTLRGQSNGTQYTLDSGVNQLSYIKIGRLVHIFGRIKIDAHNGANGTPVMTLPFATGNYVDQSTLGHLNVTYHGWDVPNDGTGPMSIEFTTNSSDCYMIYMRDNQSWAGLNNITTNMANNYFGFGGCYIAAS